MKHMFPVPLIVNDSSSPDPARRARLWLEGRSWLQNRPAQFLLDGLCGSLAITLAYVFRFDMQLPVWARHQMWIWAAVLFLLDPLAIFVWQGGRSTWQHVGLGDLSSLARRVAALNGLLLIGSLVFKGADFMPLGIVIIDMVLVIFFSAGLRALQRIGHESMLRVSTDYRILIAGTPETIPSALRQLQPLYRGGIRGVLIEDGEKLVNRSILSVPVLGSTEALGTHLRSQRINLLFLCSGDLKGMKAIMETAAQFDIPVKFLPSIQDLLKNTVRVSKHVAVDTLSSAQRTHTGGDELVIDSFRNKVVLVTGAGGSIGSELVRQISKVPIRKLILLDQDENAVFELLQALGRRSDLKPVIADIRDRGALQQLFATELPQVVLHAAAYKHVPMMEANPCEAVLNNVYGTRILAETALAYGAERFLMISSDKAVRPSSVMGATKRVAELVIQRLAYEASRDEKSCTEFACVRFGNVLGSRGSVLPIFLKQIDAGGPLTITHEQMTRYFMTIPQAANLVLQATTLGSHGDIYMLDMGDPILMMDFAREVIQLSGLTPGKDIEIRVIGTRPGEKLHEELWGEGSQVSPTSLKSIFRVHAEPPERKFLELLADLEGAAKDHKVGRIRELLRELPIQYGLEEALDQAIAS